MIVRGFTEHVQKLSQKEANHLLEICINEGFQKTLESNCKWLIEQLQKEYDANQNDIFFNCVSVDTCHYLNVYTEKLESILIRDIAMIFKVYAKKDEQYISTEPHFKNYNIAKSNLELIKKYLKNKPLTCDRIPFIIEPFRVLYTETINMKAEYSRTFQAILQKRLNEMKGMI